MGNSRRRARKKYMNNIFNDDVLIEELVRRKFRHTTQHGAIEHRIKEYYNELV